MNNQPVSRPNGNGLALKAVGLRFKKRLV